MTGVALALGAALAWGVSDFVAGLSVRRAGAAAITLLTQLCAVVLGSAWTVASGDPAPDARAIALALGAGVGVLVGLGSFYRALALAPMSIVAPLAATGVAVPVLAGVVGGERPAAVQVAGIGLASAGVVLAARRPGQLAGPTGDARAGVALALLAAVGSGAFLWLMAPASETSLPWALTIARGAAAPLFALAVVAGGVPLRPAFATPAAAAEVLTVALLSFAASALYAASTRHGLLSLVSVLASLYPAVTVVLAWRVLGERLDRGRRLGVVAALVGVVLIAGG